jgi:hypothetical protein
VRLLGFADTYPDCFGLSSTATPVCQFAQQEFAGWDQTAEVILWIALALPVLVGVVLGAPVVAREVEDRVGQVTWALALSRSRWLLARFAPIVLAAALLLGVAGVAGEYLTAARLGGEDPGFLRHDQRGVLVLARGMAVLAVSLAIGAWIGRTLPALLAAAALSTIVIVGAAIGMGLWQRSEADLVRMTDLGTGSPYLNGLILGPAAVLPDGTITQERNIERLPEGTDFDWVLALPSAHLWTWVGRELLVDSALALASLLMAISIVRRRRPL